MQHKPVKMLLFNGRGKVSDAIRWQTDSNYSHAAIELPDGSIIEAWQGSGLELLLMRGKVARKTLTDRSTITVFDVVQTPEQTAKIVEFLEAQVGKPYNYRGIVRFITRGMTDPHDSWFCSELVFAAFQYAGINLLERIDAALVSPGMLEWSSKALNPRSYDLT